MHQRIAHYLFVFFFLLYTYTCVHIYTKKSELKRQKNTEFIIHPQSFSHSLLSRKRALYETTKYPSRIHTDSSHTKIDYQQWEGRKLLNFVHKIMWLKVFLSLPFSVLHFYFALYSLFFLNQFNTGLQLYTYGCIHSKRREYHNALWNI